MSAARMPAVPAGALLRGHGAACAHACTSLFPER
ncbi:hypothetical protein FHR66_002012 [Xanthomonas sp. F4]